MFTDTPTSIIDRQRSAKIPWRTKHHRLGVAPGRDSRSQFYQSTSSSDDPCRWFVSILQRWSDAWRFLLRILSDDRPLYLALLSIHVAVCVPSWSVAIVVHVWWWEICWYTHKTCWLSNCCQFFVAHISSNIGGVYTAMFSGKNTDICLCLGFSFTQNQQHVVWLLLW